MRISIAPFWSFIEEYRIELLSNRELQVNFIRKMDDICGVKRTYYFAYGGNMLPARLVERIEKYHTAFRSVFPCHKFTYNKKSIDGTAKANIEPDEGEKVHGVCYEIDKNDLAILKKYEGGYDQRNIVVTAENGEEVNAVTYIFSTIGGTLEASEEYKSMVLKGAKHWGISQDYVSSYLG